MVGGSFPIDGNREVVTIEIPAGATESNVHDMVGDFTKNIPKPDSGQINGFFSVSLIPVEFNNFSGQNAAQMVAEDKEETVGAFTVANLNDKDGDGTIDNVDIDVKPATAGAAGVSDEVDLMKLEIKGPTTGRMKVTAIGGTVKFWDKKTKETAVALTPGVLFINAADLPKTLWVEATAVSASVRDIHLKLGYEPPGGGDLVDDIDRVKATAVWVTRSQFINAGAELPNEIDQADFISTFQTAFASQWGVHSVGTPPSFHLAECHEFLIQPAAAFSEPSITFDVGRPRETRVWRKHQNGTTDVLEVEAFPSADIANDGPRSSEVELTLASQAAIGQRHLPEKI